MPTIRFDAVVLGSSLGGWVAACYLARAGLRVVAVEEATLAQRPPLLREPFLISGLEAEAPLQRLLRELALPLIEQRSVRHDPLALQVLGPGARTEIRAPIPALLRELVAYGLVEPEPSRSWLESAAAAGDALRERLWEVSASAAPSLMNRLADRTVGERTPSGELPPPPAGLAGVVRAIVAAASGLDDPDACTAPALVLRGALGGGFAMPDAAHPFVDLFRRRFQSLHGEIRGADGFDLADDRGEVALRIGRSELVARALVLAAPRECLTEALSAPAPRWLGQPRAGRSSALRLFRAGPGTLPVGLAPRAIWIPDHAPDEWRTLARHPDPGGSGVEWLVVGGPGAADCAHDPLGELAPFGTPGLVPVDPGPTPLWDLDPGARLFSGAPVGGLLRSKPPVALVGPESSAGLGVEGEILRARSTALRVADRLGAGRRPGARPGLGARVLS